MIDERNAPQIKLQYMSLQDLWDNYPQVFQYVSSVKSGRFNCRIQPMSVEDLLVVMPKVSLGDTIRSQGLVCAVMEYGIVGDCEFRITLQRV